MMLFVVLVVVQVGWVLGDHIRASRDLSSLQTSDQVRLEWLRQFGYLGTPATTPTALNDIPKAVEQRLLMSGGLDEVAYIPPTIIEELQKYAGIPETGKFDENTVRMMMTPRCQNPDILDVNRSQLNKFFLGQTDSDLQSRLKRAATSSGRATPKWTKTDLTFSFENTTPQNPRTKDILTAAFEAWGECSTPTFTEVELSQGPDIEIKFARALHEPPNKCAFDGPAGVKAHAFYPPVGLAHFDEDEDWTDDCVLYTVALHEIGHVLGLAHSPSVGSIMFAYFNSEFVKERCEGEGRRALSETDINDIRSLYGSVHCDKTGDPVVTDPTVSKPAPAALTTAGPGDLDHVTTPTPGSSGSSGGSQETSRTFTGSRQVTFATKESWMIFCGDITENKLVSPNYPDFYPNGMTCTWNVTAPRNMGAVMVYIIDFSMEDGEDGECVYDYLLLTEEDGTEHKLCGAHTEPVRSNSKSLAVEFHSDLLKQERGFSLLFVYEPAPECVKVFDDLRGIITPALIDPQFRSYNECTYHISSPQTETRILVIAENYCDGFELYENEDHNSPTSCSDNYFGHFISNTSDLFLKFNPASYPYFSVKYQVVQPPAEWCSAGELVSRGSWAPERDLQGMYLPSTDCVMFIPGDTYQNSNLSLTIKQLDLEEDKACSYDYLELYIGDATHRYCGSNSSDITHITSQDVLLVFHSDGTVQGSGFELELVEHDTSCRIELTPTDTDRYKYNEVQSVEAGCGYKIGPNRHGHRASKYFMCFDFNSEWESACDYGYVTLGENKAKKYCWSFSASYTRRESDEEDGPPDFMFTPQWYTTPGRVGAMKYLQLSPLGPDDTCHQILSLQPGSHQRYSYRHHHHNKDNIGATCLAEVKGVQGYYIEFIIQQVTLKKSSRKCNNDEFLRVYPGNKGCEGVEDLCKTKKRRRYALQSKDLHLLFSIRDKKFTIAIEFWLEPSGVDYKTGLPDTTSTSPTVGPTSKSYQLIESWCPRNYPNPYYFGTRCCSGTRERNINVKGCRGGALSMDSKCCAGNDVACPGPVGSLAGEVFTCIPFDATREELVPPSSEGPGEFSDLTPYPFPDFPRRDY